MPKQKLKGQHDNVLKPSGKPTSWGPVPNTSTSTNGWNAPSTGTDKIPTRSVTTRTGAKRGKGYIVSDVPELRGPGALSEVTYRPGKGMAGPIRWGTPGTSLAYGERERLAAGEAAHRANERAAKRRTEADHAEAIAAHAERIAAQKARHARQVKSATFVEKGGEMHRTSAPVHMASAPLSKGEADALYRAALGAARMADSPELAESCTERAREYRRIVRRAESVPAPARPRVKDMTPVPVKDVPDVVKAIARSMSPREWTAVSFPKGCTGSECRLYARISGTSIRYVVSHNHTEG